ncbi:MAG TPA: zinc-dependent metalloprotease [Candidatus Dormibacteraeota bacterium]|jgi:coenzyme F420 biosynthesis associated uncharacterized protein|nr:zinc-dependent metalloprotease [Candidatus Dormibacteraeota bacterium]
MPLRSLAKLRDRIASNPSLNSPAGRWAIRGVATALVVGAAAGIVKEATRSRGGRGQLLDWDEVSRLAHRRIGAGDRLTPTERRRLTGQYNRLADNLESRLLATLGPLPKGSTLPKFQALGRREWADLNVTILRQTIEPLVEAQGRLPNNRLVDLGRAGLNRYVATVLAFLSHRVLGQFDPQLLGKEPLEAPDGLYLVEPNIAAWQTKAQLPGEELRRWIILHEMTHAWQFEAHPWLRTHLNGILNEMVSLMGEGPRDPLGRLRSLASGAPRQWAVIRRMQATMSLIEGHGNLVMNLVGKELLPNWGLLEAAYRDRSAKRGALEVLFWKVTGLDLKLQQYERGEAFASAIYEKHGMKILNRAWESAETLPRLEELGRPEDWYKRVTARTVKPRPPERRTTRLS